MTDDDSRSRIFRRIKAATGALMTKAPLPDDDESITHSAPRLDGADPPEILRRNFKAVHRRPMSSVKELAAFRQSSNQLRGQSDSPLFNRILLPAGSS